MKQAAGHLGLVSGWAAGADRGVENLAQDIADGAMFVGRLMSPQSDIAMNPPGQRAPDQVVRAGKAAVDYADRVLKDPRKPWRDARQFGHQLNVNLNPSATPSADTSIGEFNRLHRVGQNQGELGVNVAVGVGGAEVALALGAAGRTAQATRYLTDANHVRAAAYLRTPYTGMGDHSVLPRRLNAPKILSDSPLFRRTFRYESQGGAYVKHVEADPYAYGFRLPKGMGAKGWSGKKAGVKKLVGLERAWAATPETAKSLLGGAAGGGREITSGPISGEESW